MAPSIDGIRNAQRADGPAAILAIGTANPSNVIYQGSYPELYFGVTKSEHMSDLKNMFKRMCHGTTIKKRYVHITEELLKENPELYKLDVPSLDIRQEIMLKEVPILGKEASLKAMEEWSRPKSSITHVIFCTSSCIDMPGADYQLTKSLGLDPSVCRYMLYQQGCRAGGTVLRLAKDLAENNRGARVLAVCCEMTVLGFHGPTPIHLDSMIGQALFADGASAVIVGADPIESIERPVFHLVSASQTILAESEGRIKG